MHKCKWPTGCNSNASYAVREGRRFYRDYCPRHVNRDADVKVLLGWTIKAVEIDSANLQKEIDRIMTSGWSEEVKEETIRRLKAIYG